MVRKCAQTNKWCLVMTQHTFVNVTSVSPSGIVQLADGRSVNVGPHNASAILPGFRVRMPSAPRPSLIQRAIRRVMSPVVLGIRLASTETT